MSRWRVVWRVVLLAAALCGILWATASPLASAQGAQSLTGLLDARAQALGRVTGIELDAVDHPGVKGVRVRPAEAHGGCVAEVEPDLLVKLGATEPAEAQARATWAMLLVYGQCAEALSRRSLSADQVPATAHAYALLLGRELGVSRYLGVASELPSYEAFWASACRTFQAGACTGGSQELRAAFDRSRELHALSVMASTLSQLGYFDSARAYVGALDPYLRWSGRPAALRGQIALQEYLATAAPRLARTLAVAENKEDTETWRRLAFIAGAAKPLVETPPRSTDGDASALLDEAERALGESLSEAPGFLPVCTQLALVEISRGVEASAAARDPKARRRALSAAGQRAMAALASCDFDPKGVAAGPAPAEPWRVAALEVGALARVARGANLAGPMAAQDGAVVAQMLVKASEGAQDLSAVTGLPQCAGFNRWLWTRQRVDPAVLAVALLGRAPLPAVEGAREARLTALRTGFSPPRAAEAADGWIKAWSYLASLTDPTRHRSDEPAEAAAAERLGAALLKALGAGGAGVVSQADKGVEKLLRGALPPGTVLNIPLGAAGVPIDKTVQSLRLAVGRDVVLEAGEGGDVVVVLSPETVDAMMRHGEGGPPGRMGIPAVGADTEPPEPPNTIRAREGLPAYDRCPRWRIGAGLVITTCRTVEPAPFPGFGTLEDQTRPFP